MASGKRLDGESFDDYRSRLKNEARILKARLKGTPFWIAAFQGTYRKKGESKV